MKIIAIHVHHYLEEKDSDMKHAAGQEVITVTLETDEAINGFGFVSLPLFAHGPVGDLIATLIKRNFSHSLLNQNPLNTEDLWQKMYQASWKLGGRGLFRKAMSAVDIALWDIKGKKHNTSIAQLFGSYREEVPTYANVAHQLPPDALGKKAAEYVAHGHKALKIRCSSNAVSLNEANQRVQAVREAIGPDIKLMVDLNGTWDVDTTIQQLKKWEKYNLYWMEEPVHPENISGYLQIKQYGSPTYIAGGEQHEGLNDFKPLIEQRGIDIAQPDVGTTGGITDWLKIYQLATLHNIPVSPWNLQQVHIQMATGLPNVKWIEYFTPDRGFFQNRLFKNPLLEEVKKEEGIYFNSPKTLGFGIELDKEIAQKTLVKTAL